MSGFTPGPWGYDSNRGVIGVFSGDQLIAEINADDNLAHANARLIASAPALLDALEAAEEWDSHDDTGYPAVWLEAARAAIAAARGDA